jgi:hypothetical protein
MRRTSPVILVVLAFIIFATVACLCGPSNHTRGPLVFSPQGFPDAQVGTPYEATVSISQNETPAGSFYLSEGTLPPGLELVYMKAEDTARITGIPIQAGTYTFTISVWCFGTSINGQMGTKQYTIVVADLLQAEGLIFSPQELPDARAGVSYEAAIRISQNDTPVGGISLSDGTLPPGLELVFMDAEETAILAGTPTQEGTYAFTIRAWCFGTQESGQTGDKPYTLVVGP